MTEQKNKGAQPGAPGPIGAYLRLARALRDAADAVEEIAAGKVRKPRHRGPIALSAEEQAEADARFASLSPEERVRVKADVDRAFLRAGLRKLT